ncbi:MAG: cytochrome d ubiquinol oxidase subunit II [Gammaproteobacteria bacterium]|nr:cytochrome d ubiquinol oxidase subunit II [Gammaproteobacteria bacterium]
MDLPLFFYALTGFAVLMYVILDGFDLGVGLLLPLVGEQAERDRMIAGIVPLWDGNETWLVFGGVLLFAAFPPAYAALLPALYVPLILMLLGLVLRGVAFEFRYKTRMARALWDGVFFLGSLLAAAGQGFALGAYVESLPGGGVARLSPFILICAAGLCAGYALLGATWLVMKNEGELQERARAWARACVYLLALGLVAVTLATPLARADLAARWFSLPHVLYLAPLPLLAVLLLTRLLSILPRAEREPFGLAIAVFVLGFAGLVASHFPYLGLGLSLQQAAASPKSLEFLIVGVVLLLPIILGYTAYAYRVFRGKTPAAQGY